MLTSASGQVLHILALALCSAAADWNLEEAAVTASGVGLVLPRASVEECLSQTETQDSRLKDWTLPRKILPLCPPLPKQLHTSGSKAQILRNSTRFSVNSRISRSWPFVLGSCGATSSPSCRTLSRPHQDSCRINPGPHRSTFLGPRSTIRTRTRRPSRRSPQGCKRLLHHQQKAHPSLRPLPIVRVFQSFVPFGPSV